MIWQAKLSPIQTEFFKLSLIRAGPAGFEIFDAKVVERLQVYELSDQELTSYPFPSAQGEENSSQHSNETTLTCQGSPAP